MFLGYVVTQFLLGIRGAAHLEYFLSEGHKFLIQSSRRSAALITRLYSTRINWVHDLSQ